MWSRAKETEFRSAKDLYDRLVLERIDECNRISEEIDELIADLQNDTGTGNGLVGNSQARAKLLSLLNHPSIEAMNYV